MSDASSQEEEDFEGTQDSDAGSIGDGKSSPATSLTTSRYSARWFTEIQN